YKVTGVQTCALPIFLPRADNGLFTNFIITDAEAIVVIVATIENSKVLFDVSGSGVLIVGAQEFIAGGFALSGSFDLYVIAGIFRSEERRVGKVCRS